MIFRAWLSISIMAFLSWSVTLGLQGRIPDYESAPYTFLFHTAAPWVLILFAIKSWYRVFIWKRMLRSKQAPPVLSRGYTEQTHYKTNTLVFSIGLQALFLFALSGILNQFSVQYIGWWLASVTAFVYAIKALTPFGAQS